MSSQLFLIVFVYFIDKVFNGSMDINKLNSLISFIGIFATFGGAYLGAKISGENANELFAKQLKENEKTKMKKIAVKISLTMDQPVVFMDRISKNYKEGRISTSLYRKFCLVKDDYTLKENAIGIFKEKIATKNPKQLKLRADVVENLESFKELVDSTLNSDDVVVLHKKQMEQFFLLRQVLKKIITLIKDDGKKEIANVGKNGERKVAMVHLPLEDEKVEEEFLEFFIQLSLLINDIQEWAQNVKDY
ncbi:hypothetical protein [Tetragenococcus halophilus]|uniref:Uncharacterized protein n=1 Tax=Tetragenococcus halophilus TaxID=51669 RepID=A0AB37D2N5_TETHA|nr:hypothetical protein [Tetragenococcus halophilus]QGP76213.1 hypothetical protein GLW17_04910 [Tetragenococcus halophilus]